ncbi:hypothetical protein AYL20_01240 [Acinetobacter venetianus]|uniref:hypothetical protein n=1 Tax=Acinetobacter venetianus TaxID=52133 RepID=UPI000775F1E7|nr:hypothetical protein [Acinetobacter venetianus]KXO82648.1 hypothetical protein AYL20_01240 [Acinetobacter venetianus]
MSNRASTPFPIYNDTDGSPLDAGFIYFGPPNNNPLTTQIALFYDAALTQPAENPARTSNGYVVKSGAIRQLFCAEPIISIVVQNKRNETVWNAAYVNLNPGITTDAVIDAATGDSQADINADTLRISENLADLNSIEEARDNLDVYSKEYVDGKTGAASEEAAGIAEIATQEEVDAGVDDLRILTPKKLKAYIDSITFGIGQTYQNMTASRNVGTPYTNETKKPIFLSIIVAAATDGVTTSVTVEGKEVGKSSNANQDSQTKTITVIVNPQEEYQVDGDMSKITWWEYRDTPTP